MKKITFVIPSRNNLDFLKIAYKSIRNLRTKHEVLILDDYSIDGTNEWLLSLGDDNLIHYRNEGPERIGIVGMFDKGIEMAKTEIIFAFHADMIAGPNLDLNILKHLKPQTVVCATRIEPPLHGPGPEKIIQNWGNEAEEIDFNAVINSIGFLEKENENKITKGIFAPWCMYKSDYLKVGGHDELFAPQSKEDSDLFNRFVLNGYELIQSWDGLVYHFTSRGSRFNKYSGGAAGKDSEEWKFTTNKNGRNFIRKWGHFVKHDEFMHPIIPNKFDIGFNIKNCNEVALFHLEPWCSALKLDCEYENYIEKEQKNTLIDLSKKITKEDLINNIIIDIDVSNFDNNKFAVIQNISEIINKINAFGTYQVQGLNITINSLETYEKDFIKK
jgi:glycosyltransferase involved in cell wall biosynthesis